MPKIGTWSDRSPRQSYSEYSQLLGVYYGNEGVMGKTGQVEPEPIYIYICLYIYTHIRIDIY